MTRTWILFWIVVVGCLVSGAMLIVHHEAAEDTARGIAIMILGPVIARIYSEILIVVFRIHDDLRSIERNTRR
jgi:hypothetical protein